MFCVLYVAVDGNIWRATRLLKKLMILLVWNAWVRIFLISVALPGQSLLRVADWLILLIHMLDLIWVSLLRVPIMDRLGGKNSIRLIFIERSLFCGLRLILNWFWSWGSEIARIWLVHLLWESLLNVLTWRSKITAAILQISWFLDIRRDNLSGDVHLRMSILECWLIGVVQERTVRIRRIAHLNLRYLRFGRLLREIGRVLRLAFTNLLSFEGKRKRLDFYLVWISRKS